MNSPTYSSTGWGFVDRYNPGLGDYRKIKELLEAKCLNKSVLDLGCLDGKWAEVIIKNCSLLNLVDLSDDLLPYLMNKFDSKFNFYKTSGNELAGILTNSIELIFSMDSLVRVPNKQYFEDYFEEFNRVLISGGELFIHLPCIEIFGSRSLGFSKFSIKDILKTCKNHHFTINEINMETIQHGVLLFATKNN
jgi:ubiquinone/menaquinone biosynthesis C-methylase UbiE